MYSVISPKKEYYSTYEDFFINYKKYPYDLIIKENGQTGDHPHLNIIWSETITKRTQDLTGYLKKHMLKAKLEGADSPVLVRTKKITDINSLIGGYLQKEDNYKILFDSKKYDLESLKKKFCYSSKKLFDVKWSGVLSYSTAALVIIEFCKENDIDYLGRNATTNTRGKTMYSPVAHPTIRLLMQISRQYHYQVQHLFKKAQEIHLQILALLTDPDSIDLTFV